MVYFFVKYDVLYTVSGFVNGQVLTSLTATVNGFIKSQLLFDYEEVPDPLIKEDINVRTLKTSLLSSIENTNK